MNARTFASIEEILISGEFGDPRVVNLDDAWRLVEDLTPRGYRAFVETLIRGDLEFFFQHLMLEKDREEFWLHYLGSIRRTVCVLNPHDHQRLRTLLKSAAPDLQSSLGRAVQTQHVDQANAFCLFFDDIVVVEFSVTGNAAYVYKRGVFEAHFAPRLTGRRLYKPTNLKDADRKLETYRHHSGWEARVIEKLSRWGVQMDR